MSNITVTEIARLANVSKATVSRVINNKSGVGNETRERVKRLIEELGGEQAGPLATRTKSKIFGVVIPDITNPFFAQLSKALVSACDQYGYSILLSITDFDPVLEGNGIKTLVSKCVDGVFLISACSEALPEHERMAKYDVPCMLLDRLPAGIKYFSSILNDNAYATYMCCEQLIRNGSRDIFFITGNAGLSTTQERLDGYKDALKQYGIEFRPEYVYAGDYTINGGYEAIIEMEKTGAKYTSVVASNDLMALGAMKALREFGYRIPEDVQIVGFDNIPYSQYVSPQLTTVQQPCVEMGRRAAKMMVDYVSMSIEQRKRVNPSIIRLQPKLLKRETTL